VARPGAGTSVGYGTTNTWITSLCDGQLKQLTFDREAMMASCWSPDSKLLALGINRGEGGNIGIMASTGGEVTQLTFGHVLSSPHGLSAD